jgi:hypothetical protein
MPASTREGVPVPTHAVLEGNPGATAGDYTVRVKMPDGYRIRATLAPQPGERHCHQRGPSKSAWEIGLTKPKWETFRLGVSPISIPDMHHYAIASGEVVVQVHGMAPLQFNYVNAEDDPSRKK